MQGTTLERVGSTETRRYTDELSMGSETSDGGLLKWGAPPLMVAGALA